MSDQPSYFQKLLEEALRDQDKEKLDLMLEEFAKYIMTQHLFVGMTLEDVKYGVLMELKQKAREGMDHQLMWHEFEMSEPIKEEDK